jgi:hypothetical protein
MPDQTRIPREGNRSMKEVVEALNQKKPGVILMSKIQDQTGLYQGGSTRSSYSQTQGTSSEAGALKIFAEMVQKFGFERTQQLLENQRIAEHPDPNIEGDEYDQNFD